MNRFQLFTLLTTLSFGLLFSVDASAQKKINPRFKAKNLRAHKVTKSSVGVKGQKAVRLSGKQRAALVSKSPLKRANFKKMSKSDVKKETGKDVARTYTISPKRWRNGGSALSVKYAEWVSEYGATFANSRGYVYVTFPFRKNKFYHIVCYVKNMTGATKNMQIHGPGTGRSVQSARASLPARRDGRIDLVVHSNSTNSLPNHAVLSSQGNGDWRLFGCDVSELR